jgi:hypothetical protein
MMAKSQTTFQADDGVLKVIAELKDTFGVSTNAQVIRKALALARVAAENAGPDNSVTILSPGANPEKTKVLLSA